MNRIGKTLKYLLRADVIYYLLFVLGAYIFGLTVLFLIMALSGADDFVTLGTIIGKFTMYVLMIFMTLKYCLTRFKEFVKLGTSRKISLIAVTTVALGVPVVLEFVFIVLIKLERSLIGLFFGITKEFHFVNLTDGKLWYVGFGLILAFYLLGIIASVCINKFGHNGLIAIYLIYIFVIVFLPQIFTKLVGEVEIIKRAIDFILANPASMALGMAVIYVVVCGLLIRSLYKSLV